MRSSIADYGLSILVVSEKHGCRVRHAPGTRPDPSTSVSGVKSTYEEGQNFLIGGMLSDEALQICCLGAYEWILHPSGHVLSIEGY